MYILISDRVKISTTISQYSYITGRLGFCETLNFISPPFTLPHFTMLSSTSIYCTPNHFISLRLDLLNIAQFLFPSFHLASIHPTLLQFTCIAFTSHSFTLIHFESLYFSSFSFMISLRLDLLDIAQFLFPSFHLASIHPTLLQITCIPSTSHSFTLIYFE